MIAHEDDPDIDVPLDIKNPEGNVLGASTTQAQESGSSEAASGGDPVPQAKSLKCDE